MPKFSLKVKNLTPKKYINKFCDELNVAMDVRKMALLLLEKAREKGYKLSGKDPKGVAAGAIYISSKSSDKPLTQKKICAVVNISEVTLRLRYQELSGLIQVSI